MSTDRAQSDVLPTSPTPDDEGGSGEPEGFGRYLLRERELRGIRLEQIAEQTRIGLPSLRALEQDDRARLPARVFLVGHIRAYAAAIGLNPDEAVLRFEERWGSEGPQERGALGRRRWRRAAVGLSLAAAVAAAAGFAYLAFGVK